MKNYSHKIFVVRSILSERDSFFWGEAFFFRREAFSFAVRLFLSPRDLFFCRDTFSFSARLFILPWDFFFCSDTFYFHVRRESKKLREQKDFGRLCSLWLVLWARPFYSLEYRDSLDKDRRFWDFFILSLKKKTVLRQTHRNHQKKFLCLP